MTERSHKGLVKKKITVKKDGKTFERYQWVKSGEDEPTPKKSKKETSKSKGSFNVSDKILFMGKDLTIEKVSESQKTVKLSDGKVYTFAIIEKGKNIKDEGKNIKDEDKKISIKSKKTDTKNLSTQMELYKSGIKFHPEGNNMISDIGDYSDTDYVSINPYLRNEKSDDKNIDKKIENISNFLRYAPKFDGVVYRGMTFGDDESEFNKFLVNSGVGKSVMMKSFTSTSIDKSVIDEFKKGNYTVSFEIKSKSGVYLNGLAEVPEENEVLFDKKSKFNILKVNKSDPKHIKIIMEEM